LNSNPWLVALILIATGIVTCFFGIKLIYWVNIGVPALFAFLFVTVILSFVGIFSVLEEDN
jgi:purine-cytosine permease-like protein